MINALVWNHWSLSREVGTAVSILSPLDSALRLVRCWKSIILINVQLTKIGTAICHLKVWYLIFKLCRWKRWKQTWLGPSRSVRSSPRSSCGNWTRGSSWPKDWTWVSCSADRFFTVWAPNQLYSYTMLKKFLMVKKKEKVKREKANWFIPCCLDWYLSCLRPCFVLQVNVESTMHVAVTAYWWSNCRYDTCFVLKNIEY